MKCAAVTGANGFIGGHLTSALSDAGWEVRTLSRGRPSAADLTGVDVLFHLAGLAHSGAQGADREQLFAVNVTHTLDLYRRAMEAGVERFVWLSSIKVLGDSSEEPLSTLAPHQPGDDYAHSKAEAEQMLLAEPHGDTQLCILRPPLVYGAGVRGNFYALLAAAASPWPLPLLSATAPRAWLGVHNLVDLLLRLASSQNAAQRKIWHVRDAEESSVCHMLVTLRQTLGQPSRLWPVSTEIALAVGRLTGRSDLLSRLFLPLRVDMHETETLLDWQPSHSQQHELGQVVAWYRQH